jgi:hypothetical protein
MMAGVDAIGSGPFTIRVPVASGFWIGCAKSGDGARGSMRTARNALSNVQLTQSVLARMVEEGNRQQP